MARPLLRSFTAAARIARMMRWARHPVALGSELDALLGGVIRPGSVCVDAGAHQGEWTFELARRVGPGGHVFAFEPSPEYAPALLWVVGALGMSNVTVITLGLSDQSDVVGFSTRDSRGRRLSGESRISVPGEIGDCRIRTARLDDLRAVFPELDDTVFAKVDVEGAELPMFKGAELVIGRSCKSLYCEVESRHCEPRGWRVSDVLSFMEGFGFRSRAVGSANNLWFDRVTFPRC